MIFCEICGIKYIGETGNSLKERITHHIHSIRSENGNTQVAHHFKNVHSLANFKFLGIDHCLSKSKVNYATQRRRLIETQYIKKLRTLKPDGLNSLLDISNANLVPLVVPFDPIIANMASNVKSLCSNMLPSNIMILPAFTRSQNLKEKLCPSKLTDNSSILKN